MEWDTSVPASHARIAALTQERDEEHERWIDAEHQAGTLRLQVIQRDQRIAELESTVAAQRTTIWELRAIVRGEEP
jgi:flagellar biosynthesis chaperone FliJ